MNINVTEIKNFIKKFINKRIVAYFTYLTMYIVGAILLPNEDVICGGMLLFVFMAVLLELFGTIDNI